MSLSPKSGCFQCRNTSCHRCILGRNFIRQKKTGIMLRQLAGASYLDVLLGYGISTSLVYSVFHEATEWVVINFEIALVQWITSKDEEALNRVSEGFSSASGGIFRNCIGALDSLEVEIKYPAATNLIQDPGN